MGGQRVHHRLHRRRGDGFAQLVRQAVAGSHRELPAARGQQRRITQQTRHRLRVQGGGHDQQLQRRALPEQLPALQYQRQAQVGVEVAFVELVKDHQADALKARVALQLPGEDTLGDHFNPGLLADAGIQPDPVSHSVADLFPQQLRHAASRGAGGHAAGLQHQNLEPCEPGLIEQGQRDHGGLAGAGRGLQYQLVAPAQLLPEFTEDLTDGQVRNVVR